MKIMFNIAKEIGVHNLEFQRSGSVQPKGGNSHHTLSMTMRKKITGRYTREAKKSRRAEVLMRTAFSF